MDDCRPNKLWVANMVGQQQDQFRVRERALRFIQPIVQTDEAFINVVGARQIGRGVELCHQLTPFARASAAETAPEVGCRQRAATYWSGRIR